MQSATTITTRRTSSLAPQAQRISKKHSLPAVQFARETAVLGLATKEFRHNLFRKEAAIVDDKSLAVRQPTDRVLVIRIAEAFHQALRENLGIVLFHLGAGVCLLL